MFGTFVWAFSVASVACIWQLSDMSDMCQVIGATTRRRMLKTYHMSAEECLRPITYHLSPITDRSWHVTACHDLSPIYKLYSFDKCGSLYPQHSPPRGRAEGSSGVQQNTVPVPDIPPDTTISRTLNFFCLSWVITRQIQGDYPNFKNSSEIAAPPLPLSFSFSSQRNWLQVCA